MNKNIEIQLKACACEYVMSDHPFFGKLNPPTAEMWAEWYDKAISNRVDLSEMTADGDYAYRVTEEFEYYDIPTALTFVYDIMTFAMEGISHD